MDLQLCSSLLFFLIGIANAENIICPPNEEYKLCESACPPTCQDKSPQICTAQCIIGCACKEGYIRDALGGRCVPKECEGIPVCKRNEKFTTCATACPRICNETEIKPCPLSCKIGCVCADGFIREREGGLCITERLCQPKCEKREFYSECGSSCPGTCSEPIKVCEKKCVKGCFCKEGYILDKDGGRCIKKSDCPN